MLNRFAFYVLTALLLAALLKVLFKTSWQFARSF